MSGKNRKKTALQYLDAANAEKQAGNQRHAAELMWKATQATFVALAQTRGLECGDLIELAKALELDGSVPKYHYRGGLAGATLLRDHAEMDVLEPYEIEDAYHATCEFVKDCLNDER